MNLFIISGDISSIAKIYGKEQERNGDLYMIIEKLGIDFTMKNARFKVKDNINSGNILGIIIYNYFLIEIFKLTVLFQVKQ